VAKSVVGTKFVVGANFVVGITGGIGAGKSAVTDEFSCLGITVVDADVVAREVVEPGTETLKQLVNAFGEQILTSDGHLNRSEMRELVFTNETAKQQLNEIIHPAIRTELLTQLKQAESAYVILSAPLLIENNLEKYVDVVVVVDVPEPVQLARASARDDVDEQQIKAIMNSQCSRQQRLEKADHIIDNSKTFVELKEKVHTMHQMFINQLDN